MRCPSAGGDPAALLSGFLQITLAQSAGDLQVLVGREETIESRQAT
jgi:hypothetical protein